MTNAIPLRALLVEDSPDDAELLVRHLDKGGYRVDWTRIENPGELRAALADGTWDIIVSDYFMPGFTAPDALTIVKEVGLDVPFIIVSGSSSC